MSVMCGCTDPDCPVHLYHKMCDKRAHRTLYRIDMEDRTGTPMCDRCAEDAFESGVFTEEKLK
jgi:hypothetical protein